MFDRLPPSKSRATQARRPTDGGATAAAGAWPKFLGARPRFSADPIRVRAQEDADAPTQLRINPRLSPCTNPTRLPSWAGGPAQLRRRRRAPAGPGPELHPDAAANFLHNRFAALADLHDDQVSPAAGPQRAVPASPPPPVVINASQNDLIKKGVHRLRYDEDGQERHGYFKPRNRDQEGVPAKQVAMGISGDNPRFDLRETAASIIGQHLVPGMIPRTRLAHHNGVEGHIQDAAPGAPASNSLDIEAGEMDGDSYRIPISAKVATDRVRSQLADLHVFDHLIGNVDRHPENFMLDGDKVTGIDSEMSFPSISHRQLRDVKGSTLGGLPSGYSPAIRGRLAGMNAAWIDKRLGGVLDKGQSDALKERLKILKRHARKKRNSSPAAPERYLSAVM